MAGVVFAEREEVGCDVTVLFGVGEAFFGDEELVHESEADGGFVGGEIEGAKFAAEFARGFPADLAAQAGFVAAALNAGEVAQESEEDGFDEVPIFGATGEEGSELEDAPLKAVDTKETRNVQQLFRLCHHILLRHGRCLPESIYLIAETLFSYGVKINILMG